ncbi:unnamed protein product [Amoebophrya sp. A120]|nr:unnamed protein product [Amoebophrya sp. A120]|eukprot:GSA120T00019726001.1
MKHALASRVLLLFWSTKSVLVAASASSDSSHTRITDGQQQVTNPQTAQESLAGAGAAESPKATDDVVLEPDSSSTFLTPSTSGAEGALPEYAWDRVYSFLAGNGVASGSFDQKADRKATVENLESHHAKTKQAAVVAADPGTIRPAVSQKWLQAAEIVRAAGHSGDSGTVGSQSALTDAHLGTATRDTMLQKVLKRKHRLGPEGTDATSSLAAASKASRKFVEKKTKNYLQNWYNKATAGIDRAPGHYPFIAKGLFSCTVEDFYDLLAEAPDDEIAHAVMIHGDVMPSWLSANILREKLRPLIQGARERGGGTGGPRLEGHGAGTATESPPTSAAGITLPHGGSLSAQGESFIAVHNDVWADDGLHGPDMSATSRARFLEQVVREDNPSAYYPRLFVSNPDYDPDVLVRGRSRRTGDRITLRHRRTFRGRYAYSDGGVHSTSSSGGETLHYTTDFDATRDVLNVTAEEVHFVIVESPTVMTHIRCKPRKNWECKLQICQHSSNDPFSQGQGRN